MMAWVSLHTKKLEKNFQNREKILPKNKFSSPYNQYIAFF